MAHRKFTWIGNRITDQNMAELYRIKQMSKKSITQLVALAVQEFLERQSKNEKKESNQ